MRPLRRRRQKQGALLAAPALALSAALGAAALSPAAFGAAAANLAQPPTTTDSYTLSSIACLSATSCKAGGYYGSTFFNQTPLAEGWNGSKWSTETTVQNDGDPSNWIYGITCVSTTFCWAVGDSVAAIGDSGSAIAELWQGKRWSQAVVPGPPSNNADLVSVSCFSMSLCWAVGGFSKAGAAAPLGEQWSETDEGSKWAADSTMPEPKGATAATLSSVSCTTNNACFAVGHYTGSTGVVATFAERLTALGWKLQFTPSPTGVTTSYLNGISCTSSTNCLAVGYGEESSIQYESLAEHWNGTMWKLMSSTVNLAGSSGTFLNGVGCFASMCMAVGYSSSSAGQAAFSESWNGTKWKLVKALGQKGATSSFLNSVACSSATDCRAVGYGVSSSTAFVTLGENFNGSAWSLETTPN